MPALVLNGPVGSLHQVGAGFGTAKTYKPPPAVGTTRTKFWALIASSFGGELLRWADRRRYRTKPAAGDAHLLCGRFELLGRRFWVTVSKKSLFCSPVPCCCYCCCCLNVRLMLYPKKGCKTSSGEASSVIKTHDEDGAGS